MDRAQLFLLGIPMFLFCTDIVNLFIPPPPKVPTTNQFHYKPPNPIPQQPILNQPLDFPTQVLLSILQFLSHFFFFCNIYSIMGCVHIGILHVRKKKLCT